MNSLKTMLMVAVLGFVAYGTYVSINQGPVETPPEIADEGWSAAPPQITMPGSTPSGVPDLSMTGQGGFPPPGGASARGGPDELSPYRPFSERAPAPPFNPAPMPPEIASDIAPPSNGFSSQAPPYPQAPLPADQAANSFGPDPNALLPADQAANSFGPDPNALLPADQAANSFGPDPNAPPLPDFDQNMAPPLPSDMPIGGMPTNTPTRSASEGSSPPTSHLGMNDLPAPNSTEIRPQFAQFLADARGDLNQGRFRETLAILSARYGEPDLTQAETAALTELLDQVAGTAIYSREHHLEPAYVVQPGETLPQIAEKYNVPTELLAKINGIADPMQLQPGQELKVVRGPFRAVVKLHDYEMELWLQDLYAGRFKIGVGTDQPILEGAFQVQEKNREPTYYAGTRQFDPGDPLNPMGKRRIGLDGPVAIHGTNDPASIEQTGGAGAVRLNEKDADDVFDILSLGSRVVIQR